MKKLCIAITLLINSLSVFSQNYYNPYQKFESSAHPYSVTIPVSFQKKEPIVNNIDMKFTDGFGSSITVNVTNRLKAEYSITAKDYIKAFLEQINRPIFPNYTVISTSHYAILALRLVCSDLQMFLGSFIRIANS